MLRVTGSLAAMPLCTHGLFTSARCFRLSGVSDPRKLMGCMLISMHPDLLVRDLCAGSHTWQDKTVFLVYRGNHVKSRNAQH